MHGNSTPVAWFDGRIHSSCFFDALLVVMLDCAVCFVCGSEDGLFSNFSSIVSVHVNFDAKCFGLSLGNALTFPRLRTRSQAEDVVVFFFVAGEV